MKSIISKLVATGMLVMVSFSAFCQGQFDFSQCTNLFDAIDVYERSGNVDKPDSLKSGAEKEIERYFQIWAPRLFPHGDFGIANAAMQQYKSDFESGAKGGNCGNPYENVMWEENGPVGLPDGSATGVGRLQRVKFDPSYDGVTNNTIYASSEHSGLWKSTNNGGFWTKLNTDLGIPFTSVSDFSIDPNNSLNLILSTGLADVALIYPIGNNTSTPNPIWTLGVYKSTDGGLTWNSINTGLESLLSENSSIRKLDYSPTNSSEAYAVTSQGLFFSEDIQVTVPTWTNLTDTWIDDTELRGFEVEPGDESHIYVSGTDIYESTDDGQSWSSMTGSFFGLELDNLDDDFEVKRINIATTPANSDLVYAYIVGESYVLVNTPDGPEWQWRASSFIYRFDGTSWIRVDYDVSSGAGDAYATGWMAIAVSPVEEDFVVYGHTVMRGRRTNTSSITDLSLYNCCGYHPDVHDIAFSPIGSNPFLLVAHHGGMSRGDVPANDMNLTTNDIDYNYLYNGLGTSTIWSFDVNDGVDEAILIATQDNGSTYRETGMPDWRQIAGGDGYGSAIVDPKDPYAYYRQSQSQFRFKNIMPYSSSSESVIKPKHINYNNEDAMITKGFDEIHIGLTSQDVFSFTEIFELFKHKVTGDQWDDNWSLQSDISLLPLFSGTNGVNQLWKHQISVLEVSQTNPNTVYAAIGGQDAGYGIAPLTNPTLLKSSNGLTDGILDINNVVFEDLTPNLPTILNGTLSPVITGIAIDPNDHNHVYITFTGFYEQYKVWETTDGGSTWSSADPSLSLFNLPVNDIVIQDGTSTTSGNSRVFIATDAGVYYKDVNQTCWKRYGDIPNVRVLELVLKTCTNELFAATYGRGVWKADLPLATMPLSNINIDEDMLFDEDKFFYNGLTITNNATLTITSMVYMPANAGIIIEPGSKLILDGGTLTSACGEMWQGIIIEGNTDLPQTISNQGVVVTKNDATIANARTALKFIYPDDWGSRGGIAWCKNTTFYNNKRSAAFYKYPSTGSLETYDNIPDYKSYFIDCKFLFDNENLLNEGEDAPFSQVTLWGVKGVKFLGCKFENTEDVSQSEFRSRGIFSSDASYRIDDYCEVPVPVGGTCPTANEVHSSFSGYHTAVHPTGVAGNYSPTIRHTDFDQNMVGIFFDVASHSEAIDNEFNVGNHPYDSPFGDFDYATYHTGVLTTGLTDFVIEDNKFTGINTQSDFSHGAVVQEGEGAIVAVYNNEMINLGSGAIGAGINDDHLNVKNGGEYGLRFICNENTGNSTDFEVRGIFANEDGYIDDTQTGWDNVGQAAGNTFSAPDGFNNNYMHLDFNSDKYYEYRYDDQVPAQIPHPDEIINSSPGTLADLQRVIATSANNCPSNYDTGAGGPDKYVYYSLKSNYYNLLYTYHQFIDQGNTEAVLNDIALTWPNDAWLLRDELVARSPNNSDTVLIAAADKNILPHGMLLEVLLLNPDGLRNGNVINHVKCCIADPMPQYMIDILLASRNVQTARTLVEQNLGNLRHKMAAEHRMIVSELLRDSTGVPNDTLVEWLGDMRHLKGRYQLVSHYLGVNNFAKARETMDSIQTQLSLKSAGIKELNKMRQFTNFLETIDGQGKNIAQLDSTQIDWLINMANDREAGTAADRAENILCFFYDICSPPPSVPKSNATAQRKPKPAAEELIRAQNKVAFSPNPADQYIQLEYDLLFAKEHTDMRVYDQLGRLVTTYTIGMNTKGVEILDTRKLTQGVYIVEIVQNEKQVFSDKFIVQH